jgi:hypothetical protein
VPNNSYHSVNAEFFRGHMGPKDIEAAHRVNVSVRTHGPTKAQYRCSYVMRQERPKAALSSSKFVSHHQERPRRTQRGALERGEAWRPGRSPAMAEPFPRRPWWRRVVG